MAHVVYVLRLELDEHCAGYHHGPWVLLLRSLTHRRREILGVAATNSLTSQGTELVGNTFAHVAMDICFCKFNRTLFPLIDLIPLFVLFYHISVRFFTIKSGYLHRAACDRSLRAVAASIQRHDLTTTSMTSFQVSELRICQCNLYNDI